MESSKHLILGAGLAGLSAGYHLTEPFDIFEAAHDVGGVAGSTIIDNFTFDHAIHVLYTSDPYSSKLIRSLLADNFVEQERSAWIFSNKTFTRYPYQTNMYGLPAHVIDQNLQELLKTRTLPAHIVQNFEDWILATFGEGIARNFMFPFNRKLWAADLREMGFQWIAERVPQPDVRQIMAGALRPSLDRFGPNATFWYPRCGGTSALPRSFLPFLPSIRTSMRCVDVDGQRHTVRFHNGELFEYTTLISTIPLPQLISILKNIPDRIRRLASGLRANRVLTINLGIARESISAAHWIYVPEPEFEFHRISFPMNFSKTLGPKGTSSIMAEISESEVKPIEHRGLVERTVAQLIRMGILNRSDTILCSGVTSIDPAYVIYGLDHEARVMEIQHFLLSQDIISCGRFGAWKYLNMDHAILSGKCAAQMAMNKREGIVNVMFTE